MESIGSNPAPLYDLLVSVLPVLVPLALIQIVLLVSALVSIFRHTSYKVGTRILWVVVVLLVNIIGPILYFVLGRAEE
ncbi:MAG: PLDc N-terminal domain-containing protein [Coriobacteriales bacterium]|jgi:hypothetical protein|nr:PLDc N-terminal domain-containing protein [Coriobacteriales bacterium]